MGKLDASGHCTGFQPWYRQGDGIMFAAEGQSCLRLTYSKRGKKVEVNPALERD